tara:strand:+ start:4166 stop:4834 length:669 start_codon:yes stop_codon:yes gene_type:complete
MFDSIFSNVLDNINNIQPNTSPFIILCLLISGNYLGELFPCRVQHLFSKNMFVKHVLGLLSLMFFVVLTLPDLYTSTNFIYVSTILYCFFVILSKLNHVIWFIVFGLFAISYVLSIYLNQIEQENQLNRYKIGDNTVSPESDDKMPTQDITETIDTIKTVQWYLFFISIPITIFGFILYLGEKKIEYKNNFTYSKFLFGKPTCINHSPESIGIMRTIEAAFK